jgi:hypothetical protein
MNDWNPSETLEAKLQSWSPRPPSPKIKAKLFGPAEAEEEIRFSMPVFSRWVVPGTALFAALFTLNMQTSREGFQWLRSPAPHPVTAEELATPQMASYASPEHSDLNSVTMASAVFDWTNGSHSLTTTIPVLDKNSFLQ